MLTEISSLLRHYNTQVAEYFILEMPDNICSPKYCPHFSSTNSCAIFLLSSIFSIFSSEKHAPVT